MPYIASWLLLYFSLSLWLLGYKKKHIFLLPFLVATGIIVFRDSGTDTRMYEHIIADLGESSWLEAIQYGPEPAFSLLAKGLVSIIGFSPETALRLIGGIFALLSWLFIRQSDKRELFVFFAFYFPAYFLPYGMNVVRAGLAFTIFLLGYAFLKRNQKISAAFFLLLSALTHYSLLISVFMLLSTELLFHKQTSSLRKIVAFGLYSLFLGLLLSLAFLIGGDWLRNKVSLYSEPSDVLSATSGLSRLFIWAILIAGFLLTRCVLSKKVWALTLTLFLVLLGFAIFIATGSFAGMRVLELVTMTAPYIFLQLLDREKEMSPSLKIAFFIAGVAGAIFTYRNMLADWEGQLTGTETPFLPYKTIWQRD